MTDPTEIARVAAGLTRAQREALVDTISLADAETVPFAIRKALYNAGLLADAFAAGLHFIHRTEVGDAVAAYCRDHILREKSGG